MSVKKQDKAVFILFKFNEKLLSTIAVIIETFRLNVG